jgi:hypothetical protein
MDRQPVDSSNIISIGYDPETRILEVEFGKVYPEDPHNRIYQYREVPPEIHAALMAHPSHGHYHNLHVAYEFPYQRIGTRGNPARQD